MVDKRGSIGKNHAEEIHKTFACQENWEVVSYVVQFSVRTADSLSNAPQRFKVS